MTDSRDVDNDPFAVLGVSRDSTPAEVKRAYRLLARQFHPDVNPGLAAAKQMSRINAAYARALKQAERSVRVGVPPRVAPVAGTSKIQRSPVPQPTAAPHNTSAATRDMTSPAASSAIREPEAHWQREGEESRGTPLLLHRSSARATILPVTLGRVAQRRTSARQRRARGRKIAVAASLALVLLVTIFAARMLDVSLRALGSTKTSSVANSLRIQLGSTSLVRWVDGSAVSISERLLAQLASDMDLNEPPQWSLDARYVAISMTPRHSSGAAESVIIVLRGTELLMVMPGASGRWSPVANQLAIITDPTPNRAPQLEIVSPGATNRPRVFDQHASMRLAWSDDGTQIAYSAEGQQQLRTASVVLGTYHVLVKARGQHVIPLGWQGNQIVAVIHNAAAASLVTVDPLDGQQTLLAPTQSTMSEWTVSVAHGAVTYVSQAADSPFAVIHVAASTQRWQAEMPGIRTVRMLAAWSADGTWLALTPTQTDARTSELCLAHKPQMSSPPPPRWYARCLRFPGTLMGMSWELQSNTLSYVRAAHLGGHLEFRELRVQSQRIHTSGSLMRMPLLGTSDPIMLAAMAVVSRRFRATCSAPDAWGWCNTITLSLKGDP